MAASEMRNKTKLRARCGALREDQRGAVYVEFLLMTVLGLMVAGVIAGAGAMLVAHFEQVNRTLFLGTP